ncbi:hypothetical protein N8600_06655 [Gammaproteobacteria bacterium]|nr:hypothetical protein [Gammaproteobacteria bacterium]
MTLIRKKGGRFALLLVLATGNISLALAQLQPPEIPGLRGAPFTSQNPPPDLQSYGEGPEWDGRSPEGIEPLDIDLFTSTDFYQDREHWTDPRYWRCNSPRQITDMRSGGAGAGTSDPRIGSNPPFSARWGDCNEDWPRENITSPYAFTSAEDHYAALRADAQSRGGPTRHTYETMPKWDGVYREYLPERRRVWNYMRANQASTLVSLLTPEYQQRMVRQLYHEGVNAAHQWSASNCWPEGFMRQWATGPTPDRVIVTPEVVMLLGSSSANIMRTVHLDREFPLGLDIPQWYGDTIGFWDGDALITHTANVQAWTQHSSWEFSYEFETIEIFTPVNDESGNFIGLDWETIIYDSEALVEPVRILWHRSFVDEWKTADRLGFVECTRRLYPVDGFATQVAPGQVIEYEVPDMFDRPWAKIWKDNFEQDMQGPDEELDLGFD